jgi:putative ABC transport system substrate-binding protein
MILRRLILPLLLLLAATSGARAADPLVVVLRSSQAAPYGRALEGIREGLGDAVRVEVLTVADGSTKHADEIRDLAPDLVLTLGSTATRWAMSHTESAPIVFAMVLHPVSSELVQSLRRPGGRVTGAALDIPVTTQFEVLRDVVGARRVAVLYDPSETADLVKSARAAAKTRGIVLLPIAVDGPKGLEGSLSRVDGSVDALWSVADRTVMSRGAAERVLLHTLREGVPFIGLSEQFVRAGALLALVSSYEENGRQAAGLAQKVLGGRSPASLAVAQPELVEVVFNARTAERLNFKPRRGSPTILRAVE